MGTAIRLARCDLVVGAVVVTTMLTLAIVFGPCPVTLVWPQVAPVGKPLQVKLTEVVKLVEAIMPAAAVADKPGLVTMYGGSETKAKPG